MGEGMLGGRGVEEKAAASTLAIEEAQAERQLVAAQAERLAEERAKKKVLWEEELQRELEFQKQEKARRESSRRSLPAGQVFPL